MGDGRRYRPTWRGPWRPQQARDGQIGAGPPLAPRREPGARAALFAAIFFGAMLPVVIAAMVYGEMATPRVVSGCLMMGVER